MEGFWGMGSTISSHAIIQRAGVHGGGPSQKPGELSKDLLSGGMGQRVEDNLNRILRRTQTMLERERATIMRLAHALEEHKTLAGEDVVAVIECEPGTVVDGTIYREPEFMAEIEAYHANMLNAHQDGEQRFELDPPMRVSLRTVEVTVESNGLSGNGHTAVNGHGDPDSNGEARPQYLDPTGAAIAGTGTPQLLRADDDEDDDEEPSGSKR
jgi:hypothetical protein